MNGLTWLRLNETKQTRILMHSYILQAHDIDNASIRQHKSLCSGEDSSYDANT